MKAKSGKLLLMIITPMIAAFPVFAQKNIVKKPATKTSIQKSNPTVAVSGIDTMTGTRFAMTIEHNGTKTEISSEPFEVRNGNTIAAGDNKLLLF